VQKEVYVGEMRKTTFNLIPAINAIDTHTESNSSSAKELSTVRCLVIESKVSFVRKNYSMKKGK
jgi:hypothetical protein